MVVAAVVEVMVVVVRRARGTGGEAVVGRSRGARGRAGGATARRPWRAARVRNTVAAALCRSSRDRAVARRRARGARTPCAIAAVAGVGVGEVGGRRRAIDGVW